MRVVGPSRRLPLLGGVVVYKSGVRIELQPCPIVFAQCAMQWRQSIDNSDCRKRFRDVKCDFLDTRRSPKVNSNAGCEERTYQRRQ